MAKQLMRYVKAIVVVWHLFSFHYEEHYGLLSHLQKEKRKKRERNVHIVTSCN